MNRPAGAVAGAHLRRGATWPQHSSMRMQLLLIAGLAGVVAAAACGYQVDDCDQPTKTFSLEEELDEYAVERLIIDSRVIDRNQLKCAVVCEFIYLDQHPKGGASSVEICDMTIDGEFKDDPKNVVGSIYCEGQGIPQFCVDA